MQFFLIMVLAAFLITGFSPRMAAAEEDNVVITVRVPGNTPASSAIYITGNHPALGNWKPDIVKLKKISERVFQFSAYLPRHKKLLFKFTRGSFGKFEKDSEGWDIENRFMYVKPAKLNTLDCEIEMWADMVPANASFNNYTLELVGKHKMIKKFRSKFLNYPRNIAVLLPPGYFDGGREKASYPVLYMHDGNNLFDPNIAFGNSDWGVDEACDKLVKTGQMREIIVVGIYNTPERYDEYTPYADPDEGGGNGENYSKFIINELKPYIDKNFRTLKDPKNTAIGGSSLGGLISLYIGLSHPEVFHGILSISPTLWWGEGQIIPFTLSKPLCDENWKLWMDMGTAEEQKEIEHSRYLDQQIRKKFPKFKNYEYREFNRAGHHEFAWRRRMPAMLKYLFGTGK